jgi:hypothetical protein
VSILIASPPVSVGRPSAGEEVNQPQALVADCGLPGCDHAAAARRRAVAVQTVPTSGTMQTIVCNIDIDPDP